MKKGLLKGVILRKNAFIRGVRSALDISVRTTKPKKRIPTVRKARPSDDKVALSNDWQAVGRDLSFAISEYKRNLGE